MRSRVLCMGLGLVGALAASCGSSPAMRAAESGNLPALRAELGAREKAGDLSNGEAAKVARVVADRELRAAKGEDAAKRVRESRACTGELDGALEERMKVHDLAGAEAAMALYDGDKLSKSTARDFLKDPDDAWRAVGVRTLVRDDDAPARRTKFADPGPRSRRAAMRAASDANDPRDFDGLMEAARLDPEPMVRTEALRAAVKLDVPGSLIVGKLRDLWPNADDALREDIAVAYVLPRIYAAGGHESVAILIAGGAGPGAVAGAGAVLRGQHADKTLASSATALLARTIESAAHRERMHALAIANTDDPPLRAAIKKAAADDEVDPQVRVAALARLAQVKEEHDTAVKKLEAIAAQEDEDHLGSRARLALAHVGDLRVQALIERDLTATDPHARLAAGDALAALGRASRGAPLLADADVSVRTRAACTMMVAARVTPR